MNNRTAKPLFWVQKSGGLVPHLYLIAYNEGMYKISRRETWELWFFTALKIPMVFWLRPRILTVSDEKATLLVKLNRRTRNHLRSMYFGALCVGAEMLPGVLLLRLLKKHKEKFNFIFKDFSAEFLRRCEGDALFECNEGDLISATIEKAKQSNERENVTVNITATVPSKSADEPVAKFKITLSLKKIQKK